MSLVTYTEAMAGKHKSTMKPLPATTAAIELGAGLALLGCPSAAMAVLLGSPLDTPAAVALGRLTGAALFALAVANWIAFNDPQSRAARGVITAMTAYNFSAVIVLGAAGLQLHPVGVALWPAVALHLAMLVWCLSCLLRRNQ